MWSDEAHFEVSSRKNGTYIYRLKSEINQLFNFIPRVQGGRGGCVSVWGCISGGAHGPLVVHNDRLNGPAYIKVIKEALPCFIQNAFDKSNTDWKLLNTKSGMTSRTTELKECIIPIHFPSESSDEDEVLRAETDPLLTNQTEKNQEDKFNTGSDTPSTNEAKEEAPAAELDTGLDKIQSGWTIHENPMETLVMESSTSPTVDIRHVNVIANRSIDPQQHSGKFKLKLMSIHRKPTSNVLGALTLQF
ncbi:unnamed protein product [Rotaria sp. Silwood1]|nr:unnamed protein product [Rotaria sp. Silwood1]